MKKITLLAAIMLLLCGCTPSASPNTESPKPDDTAKPTNEPVTSTYDIKQLKKDISYKGEAEALFEFAPADSEYNIVQGAYFDGETYYVAMVKRDSIGRETARIQVMDIRGNLLRLSEPLELDGAENLSYDEGEKAILVSHHMTYNGDTNVYSMLDPQTLEITYTDSAEFGFAMMAYAPIRNAYAALNELGTIISIGNYYKGLHEAKEVEQEDGIAQGILCDFNYIYALNADEDGKSPSKLLVYDWNAKLIFRIPLDFKTENQPLPANVNIVDGVTYIMCANSAKTGGTVYKINYTEDDSPAKEPEPGDDVPAGEIITQTSDITALTQGCSYSAKARMLFEFAPADPEYNIVQGTYFDGETYYVAMVARDLEGYEKVRLQVMDKNGTLIRFSDVLELDHANNVTFNKNENALVVTHCQSPDGHYYRYSKVDIDTLEITEANDVRYPFFAMAYSPDRNSYASAQWGGERIDIRDSEMNILKSVEVKRPQTLSQGMFCDAEYIYFVRSGHENGSASEILVYDWNCRLIFQIPIDFGVVIEPENINIVGDTTYIVCNNTTWSGGVVYKLNYSVKK